VRLRSLIFQAVLEGDYFFSSFFGLHFSQTLPSFLAFLQHSCEQSLPAALALSQQDSAVAKEMLPRRTRAAMRELMDFILFAFHYRLTRAVFLLCLPVPTV
jgi:hypothetical protein